MNEQKFLTELSKLLTFMYEEDRQTALSLYEKMFSFAEDETELLHFLGSPTKQAVMIARAYNAKERKLAVVSQAGEQQADVAGSEVPDFVNAILNIHSSAEDLELIHPEVIEDQISIFGEDSEEEAEEELLLPEEEEAAAPQPTVSPRSVEPEIPGFELPDISLEMPEEVASFIAAAESYDMPEHDASSPAKTAAEPEELLDDLPAENFVLDLGPVPEKERSGQREIDVTIAAFEKEEAPKAAEKDTASSQTTLSDFELSPAEPAHPWRNDPHEAQKPAGKTNTLLVILYLIVAVPIVSAGVILLLIPALAFLGLAAFGGVTAFRVLMLAFGHFAVFADIMVVLGAALILFALALLLFWIFLWFIGSAIAGLINAAIRLGSKICYKEDKEA